MKSLVFSVVVLCALCTSLPTALPLLVQDRNPVCNGPVEEDCELDEEIEQSDERAGLVPFKALFLLPDDVSEGTRSKLVPVFDAINKHLGRMLVGPMLKEVRFDRGSDQCTNVTCSSVIIPDEFSKPCAGQPDNPSDRVKHWNAAGYSVVAFVAIVNETVPPEVRCNHPAIAEASACNYNPKTKRRIRGRILYCGDIATDSQYDLEATTTHEFIHLLANHFDGSNFGNATCHNTTECEGKTWKLVERNWTDESGQFYMRNVPISLLPAVVDEGRKILRCPDLEGIEMAYSIINGIYEVDTSHWSGRIFANEAMAPARGTNAISTLTLAVLNSSGWYIADFAQADQLEFTTPLSNGCAMAQNSCFEIVTEAKAKKSTKSRDSLIYPFCVEGITPYCSLDGKMMGRCQQHALVFENCPWVRPYGFMAFGDPACENNPSVPASHVPAGARVGPDTMCLSFTKFDKLPMRETRYQGLPTCVKYTCRPEEIVFTLFPPGDNNMCEFHCTKADSYTLKSHSFHGECEAVLGAITYYCPDFKIICPDQQETIPGLSLWFGSVMPCINSIIILSKAFVGYWDIILDVVIDIIENYEN